MASTADDDTLTSVDDEFMSPEAQAAQLQVIKAKTMYEMVHDIDARRKVLFLTNEQADMLAGTPATLKKMLDFFELPKPKLVIPLAPLSIQSMSCTRSSSS